jgi:hypothetical protein
MTWKELIEQGMKMIGEGCSRNDDWTKCHKCPFDEYCTAINDSFNDGGFTSMDEFFGGMD